MICSSILIMVGEIIFELEEGFVFNVINTFFVVGSLSSGGIN